MTLPRQPRALIDPKKAQDFGAGNPVKGGTIYLTAADENGMMVSFIQSNYMGFGSGCVEPTFGISLQNRGHGFSVDAKAATPNLVAPGKRPFHTIIPAFLTKDGQPVMSYGVMGATCSRRATCRPWCACSTTARTRRPPAMRRAGASTRAGDQRRAALDAPPCRAWPRGPPHGSINDSYQDFGAGQFIWRAGDPKVEGYVAPATRAATGRRLASDRPPRLPLRVLRCTCQRRRRRPFVPSRCAQAHREPRHSRGPSLAWGGPALRLT
jgi:gamma-glutamyltranspeptidase/glutathione hydrolase